MKKILTSLALATTMLTATPTEPLPQVETPHQETIVQQILPEINYDYVVTWEKAEMYDECLVQKDGIQYYGSYNLYIVDMQILTNYELESRIYIVETIKPYEGEEIVFRVERDK